MILGQGNVALDVARILLTPPEYLEVRGQSETGGVEVGATEERSPLPVGFRSHPSKQPSAYLLQEPRQTPSHSSVPLRLHTHSPCLNIQTACLLVKN